MIETKIKARATPCYCELENQNRALDGEFVKCCLCKIAEKELNIRGGLYETEKGTLISNLKKIERTKMTKYKTIEDFKGQIPEGATHYTNEDFRFGFSFYKFCNDGIVYCMVPDVGKLWMPSKYESLGEIKNIIALTLETKQPKFKYVHVNEFSFDLKKEFEAGELYYFLSAITHKYLKIDSEDDFINAFIDSNVFRRVELTEEDELACVIDRLLVEWFKTNPDMTEAEYLAKSGKLNLA